MHMYRHRICIYNRFNYLSKGVPLLYPYKEEFKYRHIIIYLKAPDDRDPAEEEAPQRVAGLHACE